MNARDDLTDDPAVDLQAAVDRLAPVIYNTPTPRLEESPYGTGKTVKLLAVELSARLCRHSEAEARRRPADVDEAPGERV